MTNSSFFICTVLGVAKLDDVAGLFWTGRPNRLFNRPGPIGPRILKLLLLLFFLKKLERSGGVLCAPSCITLPMQNKKETEHINIICN